MNINTQLDKLLVKQDALNIIIEFGFEITKDTEEGAILLNKRTGQEVEFFCSDAAFLMDVIFWITRQIKIEIENLKIEQLKNESNKQL